MKRNVSIFAFLLLLMLISAILPVSADAAIVSSGSCGADGNNVTWTLDSEGTLKFVGQGAIKDYAFAGSGVSPWYYRNGNNVKNAIFGEGITHIGRSLLEGCKNLYSVTIPVSVNSIHCAFAYSSLQVVYYAGSKEQTSKILYYNNAFGENDILINAKWFFNYVESVSCRVPFGDMDSSCHIYIPSATYDFQLTTNVEKGNGNIRVVDSNTNKLVKEIDINSQNVVVSISDNVQHIKFSQLFGEDFGPRNIQFHLDFDDGTLIDPATKKSIGPISTKSSWRWNTIPIQSWGFENPTTRVSADTFYDMFGPVAATLFMLLNPGANGTNGHCYGMSNSAASITLGFPEYTSFPTSTGDYIYSLSGIAEKDINLPNKSLASMTAKKFIDVAHLMQFWPQWSIQRSANKQRSGADNHPNLQDLCNAVQDYQNGNGPPVIIDIFFSEKNAHTILAARIEETSNEEEHGYRIFSYDSNIPRGLNIITVHRKNGVLSEWDINYWADDFYLINMENDTRSISELNYAISFQTSGKDVYNWANTIPAIDFYQYAVLQAPYETFSIQSPIGKIADIINGIVNIANSASSNDSIVPITFSDAPTNNEGQQLYWISGHSPITIQASQDNISQGSIVMARDNSEIIVTANSDTEVTLLPQNMDDGGNVVEVETQSPDNITIENHYVIETPEGNQERTVSINGVVSSKAKVLECEYGTEIHGFTGTVISVEVNGKSQDFTIENLNEDNVIFVSLKTANERTEVAVNADTTNDGVPDADLGSFSLVAGSDNNHTLPNTGVMDGRRGVYTVIFILSSFCAAGAYLTGKKYSREKEHS